MPKRNHNTTPKAAQTVIVDVPDEAYQADLAKGLRADETLQPGRLFTTAWRSRFDGAATAD